jgi:Bacterial Ig-like domain/L,D-transpeptidase catalytic domain
VFGVERPGGQPAEGAGDGESGGADLNGADRPGQANGADGNAAHQASADGSASTDGNSGSGDSNGGTGTEPGQTPAKPTKRAIAIGVVAVCVAGAGLGYGLSQLGQPSTPSSSAAVGTAPVRVVSVTPTAGATRVDGANSVTVTFNEAVAPNTPRPVLRPSVPGTWSAQGNSLVFTPATAFAPSTKETVVIPAGAHGVRSSGGRILAKPMTEHFTTGTYSQARLAQLLAQLGYLPLNFSPQVTGVGRIQVPQAQVQQNTSQQALAYNPPVGAFSWSQTYPSTLTSLWSAGSPNVVVKGAVMAFQSEHKMTINGAVTPKLWTALFRAMQTQQRNKNGYTYAVANKGSPETLTIWHDGRQVLRSLTNTGIPVSPTVNGTFPVYLRLPFQIMQGTNPGGSTYADPVWYVSYFNGGDAVHYFPRGSYGWPQSLGCVELPWNDAKAAYPYLTYGSLVTVDG